MLSLRLLKTPLATGFALAILLHIVVLGIDINIDSVRIKNNLPLAVYLAPEMQTELENKPDEKAQNTSLESSIVSDLLTEPKMVSGALLDQAFQTLTSDRFEQFLRAEIDRHIDANPRSIEDFSDTFKDYFNAPEVLPDITYDDFQGPLGGGNYKVRTNGKVTCVLKLVPQTFDEYVNGARSGGAKDCTPKQKLNLNLRKNTLEDS